MVNLKEKLQEGDLVEVRNGRVYKVRGNGTLTSLGVTGSCLDIKNYKENLIRYDFIDALDIMKISKKIDKELDVNNIQWHYIRKEKTDKQLLDEIQNVIELTKDHNIDMVSAVDLIDKILHERGGE